MTTCCPGCGFHALHWCQDCWWTEQDRRFDANEPVAPLAAARMTDRDRARRAEQRADRGAELLHTRQLWAATTARRAKETAAEAAEKGAQAARDEAAKWANWARIAAERLSWGSSLLEPPHAA